MITDFLNLPFIFFLSFLVFLLLTTSKIVFHSSVCRYKSPSSVTSDRGLDVSQDININRRDIKMQTLKKKEVNQCSFFFFFNYNKGYLA